MILLISNSCDATVDFFADRLSATDLDYARLNTEDLAALDLSFRAGEGSAAEATLTIDGRRVSSSEISAIYYRRPVAPTVDSALPESVRVWVENEVTCAWGGVLSAAEDVLWVNHPLRTSAASYKPEQLARAQRAGLLVPPTIITTDPAEAASFARRYDAVVAKPVGHGEVLGRVEGEDYVVYTNMTECRDVTDYETVRLCPTLLQQALSKDIDLRVTVVGLEVLATALHSQENPHSRIDCRRNNMRDMRYSEVTLPAELSQQLVNLVRSYDLTFAAIDLVRDADGNHWFLELNPAGQWAWLEQVANVPISAALIRCLSRQ